MKPRLRLTAVLCACLLLSGCVIPLQRVSPDPVPSVMPAVSEHDGSSPVVPASSPDSAAAESPESLPGQAAVPAVSDARPISDPKLALFWYTMADARVFELREAFAPALAESGLTYREFDAENRLHPGAALLD